MLKIISQICNTDDFSFPFRISNFIFNELGNMSCFNYPLNTGWQSLENVIISFFLFFFNQWASNICIAEASCSNGLTSIVHIIIVTFKLRWEFLGIF